MESQTFADLGVPKDLARTLAAGGIETPFEVQAATIPDALDGLDVCGRAPTGSGKTLAFGIPLIARAKRSAPRKPQALVLAPTRELAAQIKRELEPLAKARNLRVLSVYGGVGYEPQKRALRNGVDVLVACPGRLMDLIDQNAVKLSHTRIVVIDEADRMADMGFLPDVRRILDQTAEERQTVLFSATLDGDVAVLTRDYQTDPVRHEVGPAEPDMKAMQHVFERIDRNDRNDQAAKLVLEHGPTFIFTRTRHGADKVADQLSKRGVRALPIHGGRTQGQRDRSLRDFTDGRIDALVATDVAARGIHVDDVMCVIHYDPPIDAKTYVHRSGRTARAGASGVVVSFLSPDQVKLVAKMGRELGIDTGLGDVGGKPRSKPGRKPGARQSGKPGAPKTGKPGARQTGKPGARQTGKPGARQSGKPGGPKGRKQGGQSGSGHNRHRNAE
ncbi:MAG: DEAD/DEAH box helicase [Acidimicrobiia bacterium]